MKLEQTLVMLARCALCRKLCRPLFVALVLATVLSWMTMVRAELPLQEATVVIDPGHGGLDAGVKGPEGTLEKTVTLNLSRLVAAALEPEHRVILTRTGDYGLDIVGRSAVANQAQADLFVSIHTGGGFLHQARGLYIYYFKELSTVSESEKVPSDAGNMENWDFLQQRHLTLSSALAREMEIHLSAGKTFRVNGVETGPLMVLRGADMPAVLIEVGNLTHPLEEKRLQDPEVLADLANRIRDAISAFLTKHSR